MYLYVKVLFLNGKWVNAKWLMWFPIFILHTQSQHPTIL